MNLSKFVGWLLPFFASSFAYAGGPIGSSIQGTLYAPNGTPVTSLDVDFTIQILDKSKSCVLYSEIHSGVDLSTTRGAFSLQIGAGETRSNKVDRSTELTANVFRNDVSPLSVEDCDPVVLVDHDERYVRVSFIIDASTSPGGSVSLEPDLKIGSSPYASVAASLNGKTESDFIHVRSDTETSLTQSNLESVFSSTNYPRLQSLLAVGQTLTNIGAPNYPSDAVNKEYADSRLAGKSIDLTGVSDGKVLTWANNQWVAATPSSSGITALTGDVTASGSGSAVASITADAVTNSKIANGAVSSAKLDSNYAINRLVITDGTTGSNLTYSVCQNVNEVLKWTANGWQCANIATLAPVTSVAGKTGNVSLNVNDIDGLGTAATRSVGTENGNLIEITASGLPAIDGGQLTNINATRLQSRTLASTPPTSGQVLTWNGAQWEPGTLPTPSATTTDDLGNHTATQNIALSGNWLSGDGGNEGVFVSNNGSVGVGTQSPLHRLDVNGGSVHLSVASQDDRTTGFKVTGTSGLPLIMSNFGNSSNLFVGNSVGANTMGSLGYYNTIFGLNSGANIVSAPSGYANSFFGYGAGRDNSSGIGNVFIGNNAGLRNSTGGNNVALGTNAGYTVSGSNNTLLGGRVGGTSGNLSGNSNIMIGPYLSGISSGSNNIVLGQSLSGLLSPTTDNQLNIGNLIFARDLGTGSTLSQGNVGIGTTSPSAKLEVSSGTSGISGLKFTNFNSSTATSTGQAVGVDASGNLVTVASGGTSFPLAGSLGSAATHKPGILPSINSDHLDRTQ